MTPEQIDRLLALLERFAIVAERVADVEYPKRDENQTAELYHVGKPPEPQSKEEYDAFDAGGRFAKRLSESKA